MHLKNIQINSYSPVNKVSDKQNEKVQQDLNKLSETENKQTKLSGFKEMSSTVAGVMMNAKSKIKEIHKELAFMYLVLLMGNQSYSAHIGKRRD